ncbi:FAD-dependent monooxygenase [Streptomyces sp. NA04227]|uniref:FAD-dependent monooxygenase n=1 Tax=Streptomyces sp. NA04227 TaxID=2742136 RepID=UPI0015909016|nr:FAD-dependent monooxygenase [Streptomyces sp. NA04227]QKW07416.1 FAD-dependent monooxygenase [Streptomyces sp. NA04227]
MKISCVGGGPAGLYFSILMKRQDPSHDLTVYERDPAGSTYGWGVTYWSGLLDALHRGDPETARAIRDASVRWSDGLAHVHGRTTRHHGDEGFGIGRRRLLGILAERAESLGVRLEFGREVGADEVDGGDADTGADGPAAAGSVTAGADLVVAADGVNSVLRGRYAREFGSEVARGRNTYVWLGTTKVFDAFTFAFVPTEHGWIWCYGYRFDEEHSTFVVECAPTTWSGLGLDRADEAEGLTLLEKLFAEPLDGHPLIGRAQPDGAAQWLNFRTLTNRRWHHGNLVLLGDAAHTTHYSIGAGTTLALEDAIALADALGDLPPGARATAARGSVAPGAPGSTGHLLPGLDAALARYERERKAAILSVQSAARYSARWYENLPRYLRLEPEEMFALLGQRHSPLLPYVPPRLYYRVDRAVERSEALRTLKRRLGPRIARVLHGRADTKRT